LVLNRQDVQINPAQLLKDKFIKKGRSDILFV